MNQHRKQERYVESDLDEDEQNKRTSISEDDPGPISDQDAQPGRSAASRGLKQQEPSPTGNVGESDFPPTDE